MLGDSLKTDFSDFFSAIWQRSYLSERASLHLGFQGRLVRYHGFVASTKERGHLLQMLQDLKGKKEKAVNMMNSNEACIHLFVHDIQNSKNFGTYLHFSKVLWADGYGIVNTERGDYTSGGSPPGSICIEVPDNTHNLASQMRIRKPFGAYRKNKDFNFFSFFFCSLWAFLFPGESITRYRTHLA